MKKIFLTLTALVAISCNATPEEYSRATYAIARSIQQAPFTSNDIVLDTFFPRITENYENLIQQFKVIADDTHDKLSQKENKQLLNYAKLCLDYRSVEALLVDAAHLDAENLEGNSFCALELAHAMLHIIGGDFDALEPVVAWDSHDVMTLSEYYEKLEEECSRLLQETGKEFSLFIKG